MEDENKELSAREWLDEIKDAKKRERDYRNKGKDILEIYNGECPKKIPFNILYSNTETLSPALYSQTPRPVIKRRFTEKGGDQNLPLIQAVERAGTRILEYFLDTAIDEYEKFDDSISNNVLDGCLPGRGALQVKFDAIFEGEDLKWAYVCTDSIRWDRIFFGYATKWSKVPWLAIENHLTKSQAKEMFGDKVSEVQFTCEEKDADDDDKSPEEKTGEKVAIFYQIWDKEEKQVIWVCDQVDKILETKDDPLGITGFFPVPKPLQLHKKSNNLMPTALYTLYENQARELNRITVRLKHIIEAIKYRGVYDGALGDELENMLDEDDNVFVPTDKGSSLVEGGFDRAIWSMPVEKLVVVAQSLFEARERCKQVIYEITGISDVMRGQSKASETLGAQELKSNWGTMRLKNMQKEVQLYARDTLRIMLDIASQNVPQRFWGQMTGLSYPTLDERNAAQAELQALKQRIQQGMEQQKMQAQQAQAMGQQVPPPKPPPPPPPELVKKAESPAWEEILEVLKDDFIRSYRIDIETNSTLDIEATQDQKQVSEFMNAFAQFMNGTMPMVKEGILPFGAAKSMFLEIARRFRFGAEVEDEIKAMVEPKGPNPEQMKKQGQEMQKKQKELQAMQKKIEDEKKRAGDELDKRANQLKEQMMKLKEEKMDFDFNRKMFEKEMEFERQMNEKERQMQIEGAKNEIKSMLDKGKRETQSMLDKHVAAIQKAKQVTNASV